MTNRTISESLAVLAVVAPSAQAAGTQTSAPFKLNISRKAMASILVGTPGTNGTVDAKFQWSATSAGTYADVTGAAITQITAAGSAKLEIRSDRVKALGQGPFFRLSLTVGTATTPTAAVVHGADARYEANSEYDIAGTAPAVIV